MRFLFLEDVTVVATDGSDTHFDLDNANGALVVLLCDDRYATIDMPMCS